MKVNKFIELLQKLPNQEAEVLIPDEEGGTIELFGFAENEDHSDIILCDKEMYNAFYMGHIE